MYPKGFSKWEICILGRGWSIVIRLCERLENGLKSMALADEESSEVYKNRIYCDREFIRNDLLWRKKYRKIAISG